jgi:TRAP-type C4-dicarboxylate transport system substrate-binding protein
MLKMALKSPLGLAALSVALMGSITGGALAVDLKLATDFPNDHPVVAAAFQFAEEVGVRTGGEVNIQVFPGGQLGDYTAVFEEVRAGTIEMAMSGITSTFDPRIDFRNMPYLTNGWDQARELNSPGGFLFDTLNELLEPQNVEVLGAMALGYTAIALKQMPSNLMDPAANKDVLIRVPPMEIYRMLASDLGYQTVSIPWSDLYTSLQTGVANGMVGSQAEMTYLVFKDVMSVYIAANINFETLPIMINEEVYNGLTDEQQQIMSDVANELAEASYETAEASELEYRGKLAEAGWTVVEPSEEEIASWAAHVRDVTWPKLEERLTPELMSELRAAVE